MRKDFFDDVEEIKEVKDCFLLSLEGGTLIGYDNKRWSYKKEVDLNERD